MHNVTDGLRFESLDQAQAYLDRSETHWADTRIHRTTKRQVAVMFAEKKPALSPLPDGNLWGFSAASSTQSALQGSARLWWDASDCDCGSPRCRARKDNRSC